MLNLLNLSSTLTDKNAIIRHPVVLLNPSPSVLFRNHICYSLLGGGTFLRQIVRTAAPECVTKAEERSFTHVQAASFARFVRLCSSAQRTAQQVEETCLHCGTYPTNVRGGKVQYYM